MGLDEACSICLEVVTDNGDRSWAKLLCGHQFHLDCIGSAFNVKGQMQCPNCRKIEKGQWLYASGRRPLHEFNMDDWAHDEDLYDLNYSEMSFGVHWCPFSGLTRLHSSFDEGDFSSHAYHDLVGHHTVFADHTAVSSGAHPSPYVAYVGIHPSSSNSTGSVATDGPNFNNHWNTPNEIAPSSYVLPYHHGWEQQHSSSFPTTSTRVANSDQRTNSDIPRPGSFVLPVLVSHGSVAGAGGPVASSMVPTYPGSVARTRDRVQALQAYFQQQSNSPAARIPVVSPASRRSNNQRGLAQVGSPSPLSDQAGGFYFYPSGSSGRTFQEAENPASNRFHAWERDHLHVFPPGRDPIWAPFHGGSNSSIRSSSLRQRHMPSQNRS